MKRSIFRFISLGALSLSFGQTPPLGSIVVDTEDATSIIIGEWTHRPVGGEYHGTGYTHDLNELKGTKSTKLIPHLPTSGLYNVYLNWDSNSNRATNVPVTITHSGTQTTLSIDQTELGIWVLLGTYAFEAGEVSNLLIETTNTNGYVIADAAAWERLPEVNVTATIATTTEGEPGSPASIHLTRTGSTNAALPVSLALSGSASAGNDYVAIAENNTFPMGVSTRTFLIESPFDYNSEGSETVTLEVLGGADYFVGSNSTATITIEDSPLDLWKAVQFNDIELSNEDISDFDADPDGDQILNFVEFLNGSNPKNQDMAPTLQIDSSGGSTFEISFQRREEAAGLNTALRASINLKNWQTLPSTLPLEIQSDPPWQTLIYTVPTIDVGQYFLSLDIMPPHESLTSTLDNQVAFWSFETAPNGMGESTEALTYVESPSRNPTLSTGGSNVMAAIGGHPFLSPGGNYWAAETGADGYSLTWGSESQNNQLSIEFSTFLQEDLKLRFDICSTGETAVSSFNHLTYDTGFGPMPVLGAALSFNANGEFQEWAIDLSSLEAISGRSSITLTWTFDDLSTTQCVQIDNIVLSSQGRAKSQLVQNLEAGRLQTIVRLGTSLTNTGTWGPDLLENINNTYGSLAKMINSGSSGKNSEHAVNNINSLVLQHAPNTLFIEYSINDSVERFNISPADAKNNLESIIDSVLTAYPQCEIILMTMTPGHGPPLGDDSYRKDIADHYEIYRTVARERDFLLIDHFSSWMALLTNTSSTFDSYVPDTIHPNSTGNRTVVSPIINEAIGTSGN